MKKDIEWFMEQMRSMTRVRDLDSRQESWYISEGALLEALSKLDEPEVLSQEWMKDNQLMKIGPEGVVYYVPVENLKNLLVPKKELPVVPKFVAEWIEASRYAMYHLLGAVYDGAYSEDMKEWLFKGDKRTRQDNQDKLTRAWLDGFTVEEEQKYYVMNNDNRMMLVRMMDGKTITEADPFKLEDMYEVEKKAHRLTEKEIKDYDHRYWPFRKPVEEMEE